MDPEGSPAAQAIHFPRLLPFGRDCARRAANTGRFWRLPLFWDRPWARNGFWGSSDVFGPSRHLLCNVPYTSKEAPPGPELEA